MNAVTEAVEFKPITRTAVLRAMLFADSHVSCAQIAKDAGVSTNAAGASLRRLRDDGIVCSVDSDTGATAWYLNDPEAVRRTLDNDGTPGDDEPAPEPGDTQAVDAAEAAPVPDHSASLDDPDNFGDDEMPAAAPDPDGWIPWHGGECPVPAGSRCSIRIRCADAAKCVRNPEAWWWGRREDRQTAPGDIIEYRPEPELPGVDDTEEALARRQIDLARELMADGCQPSEIDDPDDPDDYGDDEAPAIDDRTGNLFEVADSIATAVAAGECPAVGVVTIVSNDDVRADWVLRHTDPAPTVPADPDTPLECAIARITAPLLRQAEEWEAMALASRHIVTEAIQFANEAKARTPGLPEAHRALLLAAEIIEDVR